jgi:hypothetical protein
MVPLLQDSAFKAAGAAVPEPLRLITTETPVDELLPKVS